MKHVLMGPFFFFCLFVWTVLKHPALLDKPLSLEMYPFPALAGESVTLQCLVWGTDHISNAGFYVNTSNLQKGRRPTYKIQDVTKSAKGSYNCDATFTYNANSEGQPQKGTSDDQVLEIYGMNVNCGLDVFNNHCNFF